MQKTVVFSGSEPVEVFRTTVRRGRAAALLLTRLRAQWPHFHITLDLTDCDRILRVQTAGEPVPVEAIGAELAKSGYLCEPLPDSDDDFPASETPCFPLNNSGK